MGYDVELYLFNKRIYRESVIPAYEAFLTKKDPQPLINLLTEVVESFDPGKRMYPLFWDEQFYQDAIGTLDGRVYYSSKGEEPADSNQKTTPEDLESYVTEDLPPAIVMPLCVPHYDGVISNQDMTNSRLVGYLYERSKWIEEVFTFSRSPSGEYLEVPIGASSEFFSKEELQRFSTELSSTPAPDEPKLKQEFENLRQLVNLALSDPDLTLIMAVV